MLATVDLSSAARETLIYIVNKLATIVMHQTMATTTPTKKPTQTQREYALAQAALYTQHNLQSTILSLCFDIVIYVKARTCEHPVLMKLLYDDVAHIRRGNAIYQRS